MDYNELVKITKEKLNIADFKIGDRFHEQFSVYVIILEKKQGIISFFDEYLIFTGHPYNVQEDKTGKYLSDKIKWVSKKELIRIIKGSNPNDVSLLYTEPNMDWNDAIKYYYNQLDPLMKVKSLSNLI